MTDVLQGGADHAPPLIAIELLGPPRGKGTMRHRIVAPRGRAAFVMGYPDPATKEYEDRLRQVAALAMHGRPPIEGPVVCTMRAYMPIPVSWSRRQRELAIKGQLRPTSKPDWDNFGKAGGDSLKGIVWLDDAQVVDGRVFKYYSLNPALLIEVRPWKWGENE